MKIRLLTLIAGFLLITGLVAKGQEVNDEKTIYPNISAYLGGLGNAGTPVSINIEKLLMTFEKSYLGFSTGIGYFPNKGEFDSQIGIPVSINWTYGIKRHHIETGIGMTYNKGIFQKAYHPTLNQETEVSEGIYSTLRLSYKNQKPGKRFYFKLGMTPFYKIIEMSEYFQDKKFIPVYELVLGLTIKNK